MKINIRPAVTSDAPAVQTLIINGISFWGEGVETNLKPWTDVVTTLDHIEKNINNPQYSVFMAEVDGNVVGTISINFIQEHISHMGGLYCNIKGLGLGTQLLHYIMQVSLDRGYNKMECEIYDKNFPSLNLMRKYGAYERGLHIVENLTYLEYEFDLTA